MVGSLLCFISSEKQVIILKKNMIGEYCQGTTAFGVVRVWYRIRPPKIFYLFAKLCVDASQSKLVCDLSMCLWKYQGLL